MRAIAVFILLLAAVTTAACGVSEELPTLAAGATVPPTDTVLPTSEAAPTDTSAPRNTPEPTETSAPTSTRWPTNTPEPLFPEGDAALVVEVIDGDTIDVDIGGQVFRVRYIGMDTPEQGAAFFSEATEANRQLVAGQTVILVDDVSETDQFGRLLRYVYLLDGTFVNEALVQQGFAVAATFPPDVTHADMFVALEQEARDAGRGLWAQPTATNTPLPLPTNTSAPLPTNTPIPAPTQPPAQNCDPGYVGVCILIGVGDYDCAGGSGNGPNYVQGPFQVVGPDPHDLDRDNDGWGCE